MNDLEFLFSPRSVAVVGASSDARRIGGLPIRYLREGGFRGNLYPVNPNRDFVQGLRAYPSLAAIDGPIDCAIVALPQEDVLAALRQAATRGVRSAVVFSTGFAEIGQEGRERQREITRIARESGMRVLGPNCLGVFNANAGAYLTFSGSFSDAVGRTGRLALVSQSGGYAGQLVHIARKRGLAFGLWATTGNEADIEAGEMLRYMADHDGVDVIVAYLEGVRSRSSFIAGLEAAQRKHKPVVVLKVGRSPAGAAAAASHTEALAGEDELYDTVFRMHGVHRAYSTEELLDVAYAASLRRFPRNAGLAVLTHSGGVGALAADYGADHGLDLPPTPAPVRAAIRALVPNASAANPVDLTAAASQDAQLLGRCLRLIGQAGACDSIFVFIGLLASLPQVEEGILHGLREAARALPGKVLAAAVLGPPELVARYEEAGFLVFEEPARAIVALAALARFSRAWGQFEAMTSEAAPGAPAIRNQARAVLPPAADAVAAAHRSLSEVEAKRIVSQAGIRVPEERVVTSAEQAAEAAASMGCPLALKIVSPDLAHKSDVGGVVLGLQAHQVAGAARDMDARIARERPDARREGFLLTPMVQGGVEFFLGARRDPALGPVLTIGFGGTAVELYRDVVTCLAPIDDEVVLKLIRTLRGYPLLAGFRGRPPGDRRALAGAAAALSRFFASHPQFACIEINPLLVLSEGAGVLALDAVVRLAPPHPSPPPSTTYQQLS